MRQSAKALEKGLDVLEAVAEHRRELTLTEVARRVGFKKATAHRIVSALERRSYLERNRLSGGYRLGLKVWQLGCEVVSQLRLREVARPFLQRLGDDTQEHVNLAIPDGGEAVFVDIIESPKPIRPYTYVGGRVPSYCAAAGKAVLAFQPEQAVSAVIKAGLKPFTDRTIVHAARLREELEMIRARGYAVNREEWREDVCGIAAPIRNHASEVIGSISITTPTLRFNERSFCASVIAAAAGISRAMGWMGEDRARGADQPASSAAGRARPTAARSRPTRGVHRELAAKAGNQTRTRIGCSVS